MWWNDKNDTAITGNGGGSKGNTSIKIQCNARANTMARKTQNKIARKRRLAFIFRRRWDGGEIVIYIANRMEILHHCIQPTKQTRIGCENMNKHTHQTHMCSIGCGVKNIKCIVNTFTQLLSMSIDQFHIRFQSSATRVIRV